MTPSRAITRHRSLSQSGHRRTWGVSGIFNPPTVLSGQVYSNIATVVNNGPSQATGVLFTQTIPAGAAFVSSSAPGSHRGERHP